MKIRYTFACLLLLVSTQNYAQQKVKEYYPNGALKFIGRYAYTWKQDGFLDVLIQEGPARKYRYKEQREMDELNMIRNMVPTKSYEGFCQFFHPGGEKFYEGTYSHGVPDGKFTYWYKEGNKSAEVNLVNGTADGIWRVWEADGSLRYSYSYKAIPQDSMAVMYTNFFFQDRQEGHDDDDDKTFSTLRYLDRKYVLERVGYPLGAYNKRLRAFKDCIENDLYKVAIWDGKFLLNKKGKPYLEFYFSNNVPSGNWKLWENGVLAFECSFKDGKLATTKDYLEPDNNERFAKLLLQQHEDSLHYERIRNLPPVKIDDPVAIDPGIALDPSPVGASPRPEIFTMVEQMAEFPGGSAGLTAFIQKNLVYPKEARQHNIEGRAIAQIVVKADGHVDIDKIKVLRSLGYGTDEEIIRIMKSMPVWKPGKQNGRAVSVFYTLPVTFKLTP